MCSLDTHDEPKGWRDSNSATTLNALETYASALHAKGDDRLRRIYSDSHRAIENACKLTGCARELSLPGVPR